MQYYRPFSLSDCRAGIILFIFGISAIWMGVTSYFNGDDVAARCNMHTTGVIVDAGLDIYVNYDGEESYYYYPTVEYEAGGTMVTTACALAPYTEYLVDDKRVGVRYNPNDIEECILDSTIQSVTLGCG